MALRLLSFSMLTKPVDRDETFNHSHNRLRHLGICIRVQGKMFEKELLARLTGSGHKGGSAFALR